jgi:hypothetical protein
MKNWRGIASDINAISDGAQMIRNCSFIIEGEMQRRPTLERALTTSGSLGVALYGAPNGNQYLLQITSAGTVKVVAI